MSMPGRRTFTFSFFRSSTIAFRAESHDHDLRIAPQHPVESRQAAGTGVTAHAGVDHTVGHGLPSQADIEERRPRFVGCHAQAGGEAVAERHDHSLAGGRWSHGGYTRHAEENSEDDAYSRAQKASHEASVVWVG